MARTRSTQIDPSAALALLETAFIMRRRPAWPFPPSTPVLLSALSLRHLLSLLAPLTAAAAPVRFAIIGDMGNGSAEETAVATRLKSYGPEFVVTVGDNNYLGPTVAD